MNIKKSISAILSVVIFSVSLISSSQPVYCADENTVISAAAVEDPMPFDLDCESAVLMDAATGTVLYNKNGLEPLPPASVTKIMTLLLTMEAIDSGKLKLDDKIQTSEYAASKGGSQVYLEPGEEMSVEDLIKCVVISSANDAAVTLAEAVAGSETAFVDLMNKKAEDMGMTNTHFENATGLDDTTANHVISAVDIAVMSRELISHPLILKYSSIWMDSIRNGEFGLTNTNRLIRFYSGATGLKTGSTSKAKFCISATACRNGLHLIAVIMGAPTRDIRNEAAKKLLDYGFANYSLYTDEDGESGSIRVKRGVKEFCAVKSEAFSALLPKGDAAKVETNVVLSESVTAPVGVGDIIGKVEYKIDGKTIGTVDAVAAESVDKIGYFEILKRIASYFTMS